MNLTRIALASVAAAVMTQIPGTAQAATPPLETLQLGTDGAHTRTGTGVLMTWVCNSHPSRHCVDKAGPAGRWTTTVVVPQGTMVWFQVEELPRQFPAVPADQQPNCWITNLATGQQLTESRSHCVYRGPDLPFDPAPPSDT